MTLKGSFRYEGVQDGKNETKRRDTMVVISPRLEFNSREDSNNIINI